MSCIDASRTSPAADIQQSRTSQRKSMPEITSTRKTAFSHVSQVARAAFESLVTLSLPRAQRNAVTTLLAATFVIVQLQAHRVCNMGNSLQLNSLDDFDNFLPSLTGWAHHSNFARGMSGGTSKVFSVLYRVYHERMTVGWNRYLRQMPWLSQQNLSLRREDVPQKEQIHDWKMISDGAYGPFQYTAGESESKAGLLNDITELLDHGEEVSDQELNDIIEEIQSGRKELYDDTAAGIRDDLEDWTIIIIN